MDDVRTEVVSDKTYSDDENSEAFSEYQGTILWPRRSLLYRMCFLAMMPLFIIFLVGFSSPFWMRKHQVDKYRGHYALMKVDVTIGLWRVCEGNDFNDISDCTSLPDVTSYMMACQAMLCLCFIFTFFSLVFGLYENCATRYDIDDGGDARTKRPEMNAITAGVFGMIGVCMYGATIIDVSRRGEGAVHWAFPVTAGSVTGVKVCGILMAIANPISATTPSFPGQVMSLSRQSSVHTREPSAQDRLVNQNEAQNSSQQPSGGASGAAGTSTQYGVNSDTSQQRQQRPLLPGFSPFMPRSESRLSSHVSSPDLYSSAAAAADESYEGPQCEQVVVETHDLTTLRDDGERAVRRGAHNSGAASSSSSSQRRMQTAAQRRSWHFDDRSDVNNTSDLTDSATNSRLPASQRQLNKPPVPPRRDKQGSTTRIVPPSEDTEARDLLELNSTPSVVIKDRQNSSAYLDVTQENLTKRNTNPFLDDCGDVLASAAQNSPVVPPPPPPPPPPSLKPSSGGATSLTNDSWDNQPWPEPPPPPPPPLSESPLPSDTDGEGSSLGPPPPGPKVNNVPESLQYQPQRGSTQTQSSLDRNNQSQSIGIERQRQGNITPSNQQDTTKTAAMSSSKQTSENRQTPGHVTSKPNRKAPPVPILREYDNPLFNDQIVLERHATPYGDRPTPPVGRHNSATSFANPKVPPSNPPPYYSVVDTLDSEPTSYRRHSSHYAYLPPDDARSNSPPQYARPRMPNGNVPDGQHHPARSSNVNGAANKSRPRQVKREHQQRRNNTNSTPDNQKRQGSPRDHQFYGSSPDLMARSPRVSRKRLDATGGAGGESPRQGRASQYRDEQKSYRRAEPKKYPAGHFPPHWADSDL